jgi:hypothetical protein
MTLPFRSWPVPLLLAVACAGCVHPIAAPSLAPRPVERQPILDPAPTSESVVPANPALAGRLAVLTGQADAGERAFATARTDAERAVGRATGAAAGSEAWVAAQQALTALDAARGTARDAAAAVEELRADPANAGPADRAAVDAAAARIDAISDAQAATAAALAARLG